MPADSAVASVAGIRADEPLARHVQYGVGGAAEWYLEVDDWRVLPAVLGGCSRAGMPVTMIGAGSNALILDGGIAGLVVKLTERTMRRIDPTTVELSGGHMMPRVALDCAKHGLAGLEFFIGVPGTVGAGVWGNAGAFGTETGDVMISCDVLGGDGDVTTFIASECHFSYRSSRFRTATAPAIIVSARFHVTGGDPAVVRVRTDAIQTARKAAQPYGIRSLGSVFKNPAGDHAGRLIEAAGLKGRRQGGAEISAKHANFIVNLDSARAADVTALVDIAHDTVLDRFGVELVREIIYLGAPAPAGEAVR